MTTLTDTQVITASGGLVELGYSQIASNVTVNNATAGTGVEVIAPLTVVCDGGPVLVEFFTTALQPSNTAGDELTVSLFQDSSEKVRYWGYATSQATNNGFRPASLSYRVTPTAGSHTFSVKAFVTNAARTGVVAAGNTTTGNAPAFLRVSKIVQATQWPAVTTGTIICTSSTRPSAPFEGQEIYETDTDLSLTWSGSAWVQTGGIGAWTTFVPTLTQSGTVTKTDSYCKWTRFGRTIHATTFVNATASGTAGNAVTLSLPVSAAGGPGLRIGSCHIYDASTGVRYTGMAELRTGSASVGFVGDWSSVDGWGAIPSIALASTDQIAYSVTYEAAS